MKDWDGWNAIFLECHDQARSVSRYTNDSDEYREQAAKMLALMQTTLGGTLYLYQGQEIGMRNFPADWDPEIEYKDIETLNFWNRIKDSYADGSEEIREARILLQKKARDHARTPMQWDDTPNAGFTTPEAKPWMRINDDYRNVNVEAQTSIKGLTENVLSVWQYWQQALRHRKLHKDVFIYGDFELVDCDNEAVFAYMRSDTDKRNKWLVAMNWTTDEVEWTIPTGIHVDSWASSSLLTSNPEIKESTIRLQPFDGVLGRCK